MKHRNTSIKGLLTLALTETWLTVASIFFLILGGFINLLFPELYRLANVSGSSVSWEENRFLLIAVLFALFSFQGICFFYRSYLFGLLGARVANKLRNRLFKDLLHQPIHFFEVEDSSKLVSRASSDVQLVQSSIAVSLSVLLRYSFQVLGGVVMMLLLSPFLTLLLFVAVPLLVLISLRFVGRLKQSTKNQQEALSNLSLAAFEVFSAMDVIKSLGAEGAKLLRLSSIVEDVTKCSIKRSWISALFQSLVSFLLNIALVLLLLYAITLVDAGTISVTILVEFLMYGGIVAVSFAFLANSISELVQAGAALERVEEYSLDSSDQNIETVSESHLAKKCSTSLKDKIQLKNLTFCFPSRPEIKVLNQINAIFEGGKTTAIAGPSGSGKSALIALLMGFYSPKSGSVEFGDPPVSLDRKDLEWYYSMVGYVPQSAAMFGISIRQNLTLGNPDVEEQDILNLLNRFNMIEFLNTLPSGLDTVLGARGAQVSGGQRQRLALVRALLRRPRVLILDEATSALDTENEQEVLKVLSELTDRVTIVLSTHRKAAIEIADFLYVIKEGQISKRFVPKELKSIDSILKQ